MPCIYTYKNKEYLSKDDLKEAVKEDFISNKIVTQDKTVFVLNGESSALDLQQEIIKIEAEQNYGNSEFISFNRKDNVLEITIDSNQIESLSKKDEKFLFNEDSGKTEVFDIEDLIEREKNGEKIPAIRSWVEEKSIYFSQQVWNSIWNAKFAPKENTPDLKSKLFAFAQRIGVTVTTLETWMSENAFRVNGAEDIQGLADTMNRVIAVANENDLEVLTEEVAHFAIEYSTDQPIIDRMLDQVDQTDAYKAEAEKYRLKYGKQVRPDGTTLTKTELERKVRKEILGQILGQKVRDNFNVETAQNSAEVGIFTQLKTLWERFKSLFVITTENQKFFKEFGSVLDQLANQVLNVDERAFTSTDSKEVYYSMSPQQQKVHDNVEKLIDRLKKSYRNVINQKGLDKTARKVKLDDISAQLTFNKYGMVLNSLVAILEDDVNNAVNLISKAKQQTGELVDNMEIDDILNALNFSKNFNIFSTITRNELDNLKRKLHLFPGALTEQDITNIQNRVKEISKQYGAIEDDLRQLVTSKARQKVEQEYRKFTDDQAVIDDVLETLDGGYFDNIFFLKEFLYPLRGIANPVFQAIHSLMVIAEREVKKVANNFAVNFSNIVLKNKIADKDAKWLKDGYTLRNGQKTYNIESFLSLTEEAFKDRIEAEKNPQEKEKLIEEMQQTLEREKRTWLEQVVSNERLGEMDKLSSGARALILNRALDKKRLLDKYRLADGTLPVQNISNADFAALSVIESAYKENMSPYRRDGSLKYGNELQVAFDLIKYRDDIVKNSEGAEYDYDVFKQAAKEQGIDLAKPLNLTEPQKKWLANNAIYTYSQEVRDQLDANGGTEVDTEEMPIIDSFLMDEILSNLVVELPNKNTPNSPENYQVIYEALLAKRQALAAPYKVQGKPGEIDGLTLSQNTQVLNAINTVNQQLSKFKLIERLDVTFVSEGNDAYNTRIQQLRGNENALRDFKNNEAKVEFRNGVEVPTTYHYKRTRLADEDRNKFPKTYQPNFKWQVNQGATSFFNPKYNQKFAGKTIQLKLDNPRLKNKVPKHIIEKLQEKFIDVKDGITYGELFIDDSFFEKFGISQNTDFWGEKGATLNKGLWELREFIINEKTKADKEYGVYNKLFQIPQTQATVKEMTDKGVYEAMRAQFGLSFLQENDDVVSGDADRVTVPKRYVNKLPNPKLLSDDISRLYGKYVEAGANYQNKNKILPQIQILQERLKNSTIGESNDPVNTNLFKMLDRWLSVHLYGNLVDELGWAQKGIKSGAEKLEGVVPEFAKPFVHTLGKVSPAKFAFWLYKYMRNTNLGLHTVVPLVNMINSATNTAMEHLSENQVSRESLLWATEMVGRNYFQHVGDSGSISPKSKMMRLLRYSNLFISPEKMYDGITKNVLYRSVDDPLFINYRPFSIAIAGHALFSIFDSYRLINNDFININKFRENSRKADPTITEMEINFEWSRHRENSYYNFLIENNQKNTIEIDRTKLQKAGYLPSTLSASEIEEKVSLLESRIITNAEVFQAKIEAQATRTDRPLVFSNPIFMFLGLHSQYFFNFLQNRFADKRYNLQEQRYEEGNYVTMGKLMRDILTDQNTKPLEKMKSFIDLMASATTFGLFDSGLKGLSEFEQANVKRSGADLSFYLVTMAMFLLMNAAADDDDSEDKWLKDYLALLSTRALMEIGSSTLPTAAFDIAGRIESPVPGFHLIERFMDIPFLLSPKYSEEIDRGVYEGMSRRQKSLLQMTFLNNAYSYYYRPERKYRATNLYFKSNIINTPALLLKEIEED